jgi:hypothetical protein
MAVMPGLSHGPDHQHEREAEHDDRKIILGQ